MPKKRNELCPNGGEAKEANSAPAISKRKLLTLRRYAVRRDLLSVLLEDARTYTLAETDSLIEHFMKGVN